MGKFGLGLYECFNLFVLGVMEKLLIDFFHEVELVFFFVLIELVEVFVETGALLLDDDGQDLRQSC